jgi:hypothetical protein
MSTESARAPDGGAGRVPDFFIVGHHKSGTTAMYQMLRRHPQIYMPDMKEPEFFGRDLSRRAGAAAGCDRRAPTYAGSRPRSYAEYLALFAAAEPEQRVGEASPSYLVSPSAASAIAAVQPAARIVAILREPASFLHSLHLQMLRNHVQSESDLGKAIAGDGLRGNGDGVRGYLDRVRYVDQLRRYHDVFSPDQVLVLIYDDFRSDNETTVRGVLRFLDVDADVPIRSVDANPSLLARSRTVDRWSHALRTGRGPLSRGVKATSRAIMPRRLRRRALSTIQRKVVYGAAAPPDEALTMELRRRFKPEVVALSEYLNRDLVGLWGYDEIASPSE